MYSKQSLVSWMPYLTENDDKYCKLLVYRIKRTFLGLREHFSPLNMSEIGFSRTFPRSIQLPASKLNVSVILKSILLIKTKIIFNVNKIR